MNRFVPAVLMLLLFVNSFAQTGFKPKYNNSAIYTGIEVGSKGVKLSIVEIGKDAQAQGAFNILKDTSVNTDFISFTPASFSATLDGLQGLYNTAIKKYDMPASNIYTVISSGVKVIAEKDDKTSWINKLIDSFRIKINEPQRRVEVVSVEDEARLSHLGIVPDSRRYNTFIIDIGSGNTKGGFFPFGNIKDFKLFQLGWGTKSTANATEKRLEDDNTLSNFNKQLYKVLAGAENSEIIYAVNASGSYPLSDNIAFSGGIAWATATLIRPEMIDNAVISVTYDEVAKFCEKLYSNHGVLNDQILLMNIKDNTPAKLAYSKEIKRVHAVFDQRSLMAGAGLLLKIMRQFASAYETKQFYLVKNGQVGWISAYVDKSVEK
jgi:Mor family transcriptional regulator